MTPGVPFRVALAPDGWGGVRAALNGGTSVWLWGAPASGLTTLRIGNNVAGTAALNGEVIQL